MGGSFAYRGRMRRKDWRDIEAQVEPYDDMRLMTCIECPSFMPCDFADAGICSDQTDWRSRDMCWKRIDDVCDCEVR